jgi:hypothetical protein
LADFALPRETLGQVIGHAFHDLKYKAKKLQKFDRNEEEMKKADSKKFREKNGRNALG